MEFYRGTQLLAFCVIFILRLSSANAQHCETYEYSQKYPVYAHATRIAEPSRADRDTNTNEIIIVPVVVHVLYNNAAQNISDAQILSQLQSLNSDYRKMNADSKNVPAAFASFSADAKIVFCLAQVDDKGKPTTGIVRKQTSMQSWTADDGMKYSAQGGDNAWNPKRYLNIWVVNLFGRSLGYSSLPGSLEERDGVVIQYTAFGTMGALTAPFNKGRTLTHEVAHWLGLKHIWGDAQCGDDGIADTPPQQSFNNGCPSSPRKSACSLNNNGDMFMNYMDFTDDGCMNMFSKGQAVKMRSMFASGGPRNSFLNSNVCDSNSVQRAALPGQPAGTKAVVSLYPNPAIKNVTLEGKNPADLIGKRVKVSSIYGAVVYSQIVFAQKTIINLENLPVGVYILKIGDGKEHAPFRFVKE